MTISLIRMLLPAGNERRKLIKRQLRPRIDEIIPLLENSSLFSANGRKAAVEALRNLHTLALVRNIVAHDPYVEINGQWAFAQIRDAEPNLTVVTSVTIEKIGQATDFVVEEARVLEKLLARHVSHSLSSARG
jgi:hypothetical protein